MLATCPTGHLDWRNVEEFLSQNRKIIGETKNVDDIYYGDRVWVESCQLYSCIGSQRVIFGDVVFDSSINTDGIHSLSQNLMNQRVISLDIRVTVTIALSKIDTGTIPEPKGKGT